MKGESLDLHPGHVALWKLLNLLSLYFITHKIGKNIPSLLSSCED